MKDRNTGSYAVMTNTLWRLAEKCGVKAVTFIVSVILARMLGPSVYGTVSMILVVISILQIFIDTGLTSALIQKEQADDLDFSTSFYFNLCLSILLYLISFGSAPLIAAFFKNTEMIPMIRILSLMIIISGVRSVPQARLIRELRFRQFFFATLTGTVLSAAAGIAMAFSGFGVWALIWQHLINLAVDTVFLWAFAAFRPAPAFSAERLGPMFSYGSRILLTELIERIYNNLRAIIIGRKYTGEDLALYSKGRQFPEILAGNINESVDSVLFPVIARAQGDTRKVRTLMQKSIRMSTFLIAPLMAGLFVVSPQAVRVILTDAWSGCVPYIRIFSVTFLLYPVHTANLNALKAVGKSELILKLEIVKKAYGLLILVISMQFGVPAIAGGVILIGVLGLFVNSWPSRTLFSYGIGQQLKDFAPPVFVALLMGAAVLPLSHLHLSDLWILILQIAGGAVVYILLAGLLKLEALPELRAFLKSVFRGAGKSPS